MHRYEIFTTSIHQLDNDSRATAFNRQMSHIPAHQSACPKDQSHYDKMEHPHLQSFQELKSIGHDHVRSWAFSLPLTSVTLEIEWLRSIQLRLWLLMVKIRPYPTLIFAEVIFV